MTTSYSDIFKLRAKAHDDAFRMYPDACSLEVARVLALADLSPGDVLLDLPSAGGFLSRHLKVPDVHLIAVDPSPELHALCAQVVPDSRLAPMNDLPLADSSVDALVCLAGLHHEPHPHAIFDEMRRVLRPGVGRAVIAEVQEGSPVARFLNGFVDRHNPHGHRGRFLDEDFVADIRASGLRIDVDAVAKYHWLFDSRYDLGDCLMRMFGIELATPESIVDAVEHELGIDEMPDGRIGMRWGLRTIRAWRD